MISFRRLLLFTCFLGFAVAANAQNGEVPGDPSTCGDGIDNDGDGYVDCFDAKCANVVVCEDNYIGTDKSCQIPQPPGSNFVMKLLDESGVVTTTHGRFVVGDLGDINNGKDGIPEIVTAHNATKMIYILDGRTLDVKNSVQASYPIERYDIAIGDVGNTGCAQIFIAMEENESQNKFRIASYDCALQKVWEVSVKGRPFTLGLADFDHDGRAELYFRDQIHDAATGELLIEGSGNWSSIDGGPVAVDILGDSECAHCDGLELVLGGEIYSIDLNNPGVNDGGTRTLVRKFNDLPGLDNQEKWYPTSLNLGGDKFVNSQTSIADYDEDGSLDVLMTGITKVKKNHGGGTTDRTTIFYWNIAKNTGKVFRPSNDWEYGAGRLNLADLDGVNGMNVAFVSGDYLFALDENLEELWSVSIDENSSGYTSTTVFDFNNDGASEIVYRDESYLYIIKGDGTLSPGIPCKSLTSNDYPIVADFNADGATEICVICQETWSGNIYTDANKGVIRMYESGNEPWVSARKVWNQHGYFNVNVNDDLTIPRYQQLHHKSFSEDECSDGENRVLNTFLNQSAILDSKGCKTFATADIAFEPDPELINITPPTCPDQDFLVSFTVKNIGDVSLTGLLPISFYDGDPTQNGTQKLHTATIQLSELEKNDTAKFLNMKITGTGGAFTLYAVLNDAGTSIPISLPNSPFAECNYVNNIVSASVNPVPFALTVESQDHIQCGAVPAAGNGSAEVYKLEGGTKQTTGYTFYWFDGPAGNPGDEAYKGPVRSPMEPGSYTVYALHDAFACSSDIATVVVGQQTRDMTGATVEVLHDFTNCFTPDGALRAVPDGNPSHFSYEWVQGTTFGTSPPLGTNQTLSGVKALTYSVLITELATGCETLASGAVPDMTTPPVVTATPTDANCNPPASGSASASVNGTTTGYSFVWYDGSTVLPSSDHTGEEYSNIVAGHYTVVATDQTTGCESSPFVVEVESAPGITAGIEVLADQTSCATPNGSARASVGGATAGYTFRWFTGDNTLPANEFATTAVVTGLAAGEYTVEITETATGCTDTELVEIEEEILIPTVSPALVAHQSTCDPANGSVTATAADTPGPHTFYWFNGNVGVPDTTVADFTGQHYTGVEAGYYTVVAVNTLTRCMSVPEAVEVDDDTVTPLPTVTVTDQSGCDVTTPNGGASADVGGITAGYRFRWFDGADTTTFIAENPTLTGRPAGSYMLKTIRVATGCIAVTPVTIDEHADVPTLSLTANDNTMCDSDKYNGSVVASLLTNPNSQPGHTYTYNWFKDGNPIAGVTTSSLTGINAGDYTVTVTNNTLRCTSDPVTETVVDNTAPPLLVTSNQGSTNCVPSSADPNGVARVVSVDGTPVASVTGYTFQWYTGSDDSSPISLATNATADTPELAGLQGGTGVQFSVKVINENTGCEALRTVPVGDVSSRPMITVTTTSNGICDPVIAGTSHGGAVHITAVTYKGVPFNGTLTYRWFNGTDTLSFDHASAIPDWTELDGGSYTTVARIDSLGCTSEPETVTVSNAFNLPLLAVSSSASTNCEPTTYPGLANGKARVVNVDGNPAASATGYTYQWYQGVGTAVANEISTADNPTANTFELSSVQGGTGIQYTVKVISTANGCDNTAIVPVADHSARPVITLTATDNTICDPALVAPGPGDYNGSVQVATVTYKGAPYTGSLSYAWFNGTGTGSPNNSSSTNILSNLNDGSYSATVHIDSLGCTSTVVTAEVDDDLTPITISTQVVDSKNCAGGDPNGSAQVVGVTPVGPTYEYYWYAGTSATGTKLNDDPTDVDIDSLQGDAFFTVEVVSLADGCKKPATVQVKDVSQNPVITATGFTNNTNCVGPNGEVELVSATYRGAPVADPFTGYSISWTNTGGATTATVGGLGAGTYQARIKHVVHNCESGPVPVTIIDDLEYPVITTTVTHDQTSCDPGAPNGQLTASAAGVGPFSYDWYAGNGVNTGNELAEDADGVTTRELASGDYTVLVTNTNTGCAAVKGESVKDDIVFPTTVVVQSNPVTNCASPNGEIIVQPTLSPDPDSDGYFTVWFHKGNTTNPSTVKSSPQFPPSLTQNDFTQSNVGPGYWAVLVRDEFTQCESQVVTTQVDDDTEAADISVAALTAASHCTDEDGEMVLSVTGGVAPYSITWYEGVPLSSGPYDYLDDEDGVVLPAFTAGTDIPAYADQATLSLQPTGLYTVEVVDQNGCGTVYTDFIPYQDAPDVDIAVQHSTQCDLLNGDGEIFVDVAAPGSNPARTYGINIYRGLVVDINELEHDGGAHASMISTTATNLNPGTYLIEVEDDAVTCDVYAVRVIEVIPLDPIVTLGTIAPNQNCNFDEANGSVQIKAEKDPLDPRVTTDLIFNITNIDPAPEQAYAPALAYDAFETLDGFRPQTYTITIEETVSGCTVERVVNIPYKPAIPTLTVAVTDETFCYPIDNGGAVATPANALEPTAGYDLEWYSDAGLTTSTGVTSQTITASMYLGGTTGAGAGWGTQKLYVRAQQTSGVGVGCFTPVVEAIIKDLHATPQLTLSSLPNTSCEPLIGEGSIAVTTVTPSTDPGVQGASYSYSLDGAAPITGQNGTTPTPFTALTENTYTINATNEVSGCAVESTVDVLAQQYTIRITDATVNDKLICDLDGDITVKQITIDRSLTGMPDETFALPFGTGYEFRWFKDTPGTFTSGGELEDADNDVIDGAQLFVGTGDGEYGDPFPTRGAGTYYVVARREAVSGISGAGCESLPFEVEIKDESVDPVITLTPLSNTSCDPNIFEGEVTVDVTDGSSSAIARPFTYNYGWSIVSGVSQGVLPAGGTYSGAANLFDELEHGTYRLTVTNNQTGCESVGEATIELNSTPIFVQEVTSLPQLTCPTGGSLEVANVYFHDRGGSVVAAPLTDFTFRWFRNGTAGVDQISAGAATLLDETAYPAIEADNDYYVVAHRLAVNGANQRGLGCASAPFRVEIKDERIYPTISLTPFSNTSCDPGTFEGEIRVSVTDASVVPGTFLYDYTWTPLTAGRTAPGSSTGNALGSVRTESDLQDGTYQLEARNTLTGCASTRQTTITPNTTPIFIQDVISLPQQWCTPDGSLQVSQITFNDRNGASQNVTGAGLDDFSFTWYRGAPIAGNEIGNDGTTLSNAEYAAIGTGNDYYVLATRDVGGPGFKCKSAPVRVEIKDRREYPVLTFSTVANSTCDTNFDGQITVSATTAGVGAGANYSFDWDALADNASSPGPYNVTGVEPGTYSILVTNLTTQCQRTGSASVAQNAPTISVLSVTKVDQTDCAPVNGSISIDGTNPANVFPAGAYTFAWSKVGGGALTPVPDHTVTGIDAGTYLVTATRTDAFGSGCVSTPFPVVILDRTQRPVIDLATVANFACVGPFNGQVHASMREGITGGITANYGYQWFSGNGTGSPIAGATSAQLINVQEGVYTVEVIDHASPNLGCVATATTTLDFAPTLISGEILSTSQTLCAPAQNGALMVETITETIRGASTNYDLSIPGDLARYTFEWFDEDMSPIAGFTSNTLPNRLAGTYHLQIENALGCRSTFSTSVILDENSYPTISLDDYKNPVVCVLPEEPGHLQVSADGSFDFSNYTFEWFEGPDETGTLVHANNPGVSGVFFNDPLEYTVRVTNLSTHCSTLETYKLATDTLVVRTLASSVPLTNCLSNNGTLFATVQDGSGNLFDYEWYAGNSISGTPVYTTKQVSDAPLGVFTVVAINPNRSFCESIPATVEVIDGRVYPVPVIDQRNPLTYCDPANPNGVARATVDGVIHGYQFDWFEAQVSGSPFYVGAEAAGLRDITYVVRATDLLTGCEGTGSITIGNEPVQVPVPGVVVLNHNTHCLNPNGLLHGTAAGGSWQYRLSWFDGNSVKAQADAEGEYYGDLPEGFYTTIATDLISGCVSGPVVTEVLEILDLPEFEIVTTPTTCEQNVGAAEFIPLTPAPIWSIVWDIDGTEYYGPKVTNLPKGDYSVHVVTTMGCENGGTFSIIPEIQVYNGISRNGDGQNDFFEISCIQDFPNNNVKIFNRAGTLVYQARGYDNQDVYFEGTSNEGISLLGRELPDGTYFYIIDKGDGSEPRTGYLELLRQ